MLSKPARERSFDREGEADRFGGDVHAYGEWLMKTKQAVSSYHDTASGMKQYQTFLRKHGKTYKDDVVRHNSVIARNKPYEDGHEIFLAEQEMRSRTIGGLSTYLGSQIGDSKRVKRQLEVRKETLLGLGEHKGVSILEKHRHAPVPWDSVIDDSGHRRRNAHSKGARENSLNGRLGNQGYGVCLLLDPIQEKVLFNSTKRDHVLSIIESLQTFYVPVAQSETHMHPFYHETSRVPQGSRGMWSMVTNSQEMPISSFLPSAFVSWIDQFMKTNVLHLSRESQIQFLKTLLHIHNTTAKNMRKRVVTQEIHLDAVPIVLDIRVERFYSFIKSEYGLSSHIVAKDSNKEVAVISFEVTHRYILAIFLDVHSAPFHRAQHRLCTYLIEYLRMLTSENTPLDKHSEALDRALEKVLRGYAHNSSASKGGKRMSSTGSFRGQNNTMRHATKGKQQRFMRNASQRRIAEEYAKSEEVSAQKKKILSLQTTGIVDVALYPCTCRRSV